MKLQNRNGNFVVHHGEPVADMTPIHFWDYFPPLPDTDASFFRGVTLPGCTEAELIFCPFSIQLVSNPSFCLHSSAVTSSGSADISNGVELVLRDICPSNVAWQLRDQSADFTSAILYSYNTNQSVQAATANGQPDANGRRAVLWEDATANPGAVGDRSTRFTIMYAKEPQDYSVRPLDPLYPNMKWNVDGAPLVAGLTLKLFDSGSADPASNEQFYFEPTDLTIRMRDYPNLCLFAASGDLKDNDPIVLVACIDARMQWNFGAENTIRPASKGSMCIKAVDGLADHSDLILHTCSSPAATSEKWSYLFPINAGR